MAKVQQRGKGGPFENLTAFRKFDAQNKGYTTFDDLMQFARSWNLSCTKNVELELKQRYCRAENFESGVIDFDDFVHKVLPTDFTNPGEAAMAFKQKMMDNWKHLRQAFRDIDRDKSGSIDKNEIVAEMRRMNMNIDEDVANAISDRFDYDGDGSIDFQEFARGLTDMSIDDFMPRLKQQPVSTVGLLWEEAKSNHRVYRPQTAASLHSQESQESDDELMADVGGAYDTVRSPTPASCLDHG